jgi:hypothetical protein
MRTLGWTEGDNFAVARRYAEERPERYAGLADDLVRLPVDVIVTEGTPMGLVAQQATSTVPIVLAGSGDPVGVGLVASIRRPGGNISGVSTRSPEGPSKNLELLKGVVPTLTRVGVLLGDNARRATVTHRADPTGAFPGASQPGGKRGIAADHPGRSADDDPRGRHHLRSGAASGAVKLRAAARGRRLTIGPSG